MPTINHNNAANDNAISFEEAYGKLLELVYDIDFLEGHLEALKKAHEREVAALRNELNHIETSVMSLVEGKEKDYALAV